MNKENAHLYLSLVKALSEGKIIQIKIRDGWKDFDEVSFDLPYNYYRIKTLDFPPCPPGEEWFTGGLTAEQFEVDKGWRPFFKSQLGQILAESQYFIENGWKTVVGVGRLYDKDGGDYGILRTKEPITREIKQTWDLVKGQWVETN